MAEYDTSEMERWGPRGLPVVFFAPDVPAYDRGPGASSEWGLGRYIRPGNGLHLINLGLGDHRQSNRRTYVCSGGGWLSYTSCGWVLPPGEDDAMRYPSRCPNCGNPVGTGYAPLKVPAAAFLACWRD